LHCDSLARKRFPQNPVGFQLFFQMQFQKPLCQPLEICRCIFRKGPGHKHFGRKTVHILQRACRRRPDAQSAPAPLDKTFPEPTHVKPIIFRPTTIRARRNWAAGRSASGPDFEMAATDQNRYRRLEDANKAEQRGSVIILNDLMDYFCEITEGVNLF
jgi:hypothetical protein